MKNSIAILNRKNVIVILILISLFLLFSFSLFSSYILFALLALLMISYDIKNAYCILIFTFPFYGVAVIDGFGFIPFLAFLLVLKAFIFDLIKFTKDKLSILLLFILLSTFISFLINPLYINNLTKTFFQIILIILLRSIKLSQHFALKLIFFFVLGSTLSIIVGYNLDNYTNIWIDRALATRFVGSVSDPNYFSRLLLFAICSCFLLIFSNVKKNIKLIVLLCLLSAVYGVFLSLSKMGLLIFLIISAVFIYTIFFKRNIKTLAKFGYLFLAICISYAFIINLDFSNIIYRLSQDSDSLTTGRLELQSAALFKWISSDFINLLFGFGMDSSRAITSGLQKIEANVLHSIYIQTIVEQGVLGFVILINFIMYFLSKLNYLNVLFFLVFTISGLALSGLLYWDLIFFYLVFDYINSSKKIKKWS